MVLISLVLLVTTGCDEGEPARPARGGESGGDRGTVFTPPGTELEFGETAVVPAGRGDGVIELTVATPEEGTVAQLRELGMSDFSETGGRPPTPYFLRVRIVWVAGVVPNLIEVSSLNLWSGKEYLAKLRADPVRPKQPCPIAVFKAGSGPGSVIDTCVTFLLDPGMEPIDRLTFTTPNDEDYGLGNGDELTWSR